MRCRNGSHRRLDAMKFMTTWTLRPDTRREAVDRLLAGLGQPPEGVTLLGRWHSIDGSHGFTLTESNNPVAMYEATAVWADVIDLRTVPVIEDDNAGPILAKVYKKA